MEEYIGKNEKAFVYYGLRVDEPQREGYKKNKKTKIVPKYPLREMNMGINTVWKVLSDRDLLPPTFFWEKLYNLVLHKMGADDIRDQLEPWVFNNLFAWRARTNCFHCFYQRQYEWIGLLEHHPPLFWKASDIEEQTGGDDFSWRPDYTLKELADRQDEIIDKRAEKLAKTIHGALFQGNLFMKEIIQNDLMNFTSCGMFCGK